MATNIGRLKIRLNSLDKIEDLLQETYDYAQKLINEIQIEMNKLSQAVDLTTAPPDQISRYNKSMHDYITDKQKAISMKLDIAKFMGEVYKYKGDVAMAVEETGLSSTSLDLDRLKKMVEDAKTMETNPEKEEYIMGDANSRKKS